MITIYQLISSIHLGGAENVAFQIAEHCKNRVSGNFEYTVIELYRSKNDYAEEKRRYLIDKNIKILTLFTGSKRFSLLFGPIKLAYILWRKKPEIIHSHTDLPDLVLATSLRILKMFNIKHPSIVRTIHNTELWRNHHTLGKYTEAAYNNEEVVGVSKAALKSHKKLRIKNKLSISTKLRVIYNGCKVPVNEEHPFKIISDQINIGFCGRFEAYKGIKTLISIIKKINNLFPEIFTFHIIGNGTYKEDILNLSNTQRNVFIYDSVNNISNKLYAFDFVIMPSHFEGLPLVSIESSFSMVPVIASYAPGLDETLPTDWALRFRLDDEDELLEIFENIKNKCYNLDELKTKAYSFVTDKFSQDKMIEEYSNLYLDIYENK